jgi:ABC-2 type transport system ATP-binding protein
VYWSRTLFEMARTVFEKAIEADGLVKRYGEVQALDGVDLHVEAGTVFGLLGPNGAGKSTTVRLLTTLSRPDAGTVRVAGIDALASPVAVRRVIGVVGQRHGTDPEATGRENLVLQGELYGIPRPRARADEMLERFGLLDAADRQVKTYSGGMERRLDVALGLLHSPQVLFLDEPTTGLDPEGRADMWAEIERMAREERMTILLTTHYLEEADRLASRLAIVDRGKIVARGTPDELKAELEGDAVQVEFAEGDSVAARTALERVGGLAEVALDGRVLRARARKGAAAIPAVLAALDAHGVRATSVTLARPSLDDVYLRHAGRAYAA